MAIVLSELYNSSGVKAYQNKSYFKAASDFKIAIKEANREKNFSNITLAVYNLAFTYKQIGDSLMETKNVIDGIRYYRDALNYAESCKSKISGDMKKNIEKLEKELVNYT